MRRSALVALLAILGLLAACADQGASPSPEPTIEPTPEPTAEATPEATAEPTGEATDGTGFPDFELPNSAPELAALLPDQIGGQPAFKVSMTGEEMLEQGDQSDPEFLEFLDRVGRNPSDVSVAFAFGLSAEAESAGVVAFRVEGASQDLLLNEFRAALEAEGEVAGEWEDGSVGGKRVLIGESTEDGLEARIYLYTAADILFFVVAGDEAGAAEILTDLP